MGNLGNWKEMGNLGNWNMENAEVLNNFLPQSSISAPDKLGKAQKAKAGTEQPQRVCQ